MTTHCVILRFFKTFSVEISEIHLIFMKKWDPFMNNLVDHTQQERFVNVVCWVKEKYKIKNFDQSFQCTCNEKKILSSYLESIFQNGTKLVMHNLFHPCWKVKYHLFLDQPTLSVWHEDVPVVDNLIQSPCEGTKSLRFWQI